MDWYKAKNYTIIFLIMLNIMLLGFNTVKRFETTLSASRVENITKLMKSKGITIGCSLPNRYAAMGQLTMTAYDYDYMALEDIFFENTSGIVRTDDGGKIIFKSDDEQLTIDGCKAVFKTAADPPAGTGDAIDICAAYADRLNETFTNLSFDSAEKTDSGYKVIYFEEFYGYDIFSNYLVLETDAQGGCTLSLNWYTLSEESGEKNEIIAADEAVFALSDVISSTVIQKVQLGYIISEETGSEVSATPVYKINAGGETYFINSVSGQIV